MMNWSWKDGGVDIGGEMHGFAPLEREKIIRLAGDINQTAEVLETLRLAKANFADGSADYSDAAENLSRLLEEIRKAEIWWHRSFEELGQSAFVPPIPGSKISSGDQMRFSYEAMIKIGSAVNGGGK